MRSRPFETRSRPRFDSCAPRPFRPLGLPIYVAGVPRGSIRSLLPSQLYLDHSHGPVLAPGRAELHSLAALPSTRSIETRLLPSFDSCAPAHLKLGRVPASSPLPSRLCLLCRFPKAPFDLSVLPIYVARALAAPFSPLPTAALPSMSLSPNAPFPHSRRVLCRSMPLGS